MNETIRDQAAQALFNEVYRMFLDGTFAETEADRDIASQKFMNYLRGSTYDELVSVLCTAFDELVIAQMPDDEQGQDDTPPAA